MPNYCYFDAMVAGRPEAIDRFAKAATDYDEPRHLWRVFELSETGRDEKADGTATACFWGYCAWSVFSCMCRGAHTYADAYPERSTSLMELSADLGLDIEIFSREPGLGFSEHYLYRHGSEDANETADFSEWLYEPCDWKSFAEFARETGLPEGVLESDFVDGIYVHGGYDVVWSI